MTVHACPEVSGAVTLCRRSTEGTDWAVSCFADQWTCPACLRLYRLLVRVHATAERFRRGDDVRDLLDAVVPGSGIDALTEAEARRVLVVLDKVLAGVALRRERGTR